MIRQHAADHVRGVKIAHIVNNAGDLVSLPAQNILGKIMHVEPRRDRKASQQDSYKADHQLGLATGVCRRLRLCHAAPHSQAFVA
jgi:hypothetical protein